MKEKNTFEVLSVVELEDKYKDIPFDDRAYRRGYQHGYQQALDDIRYDKNTSKFTKYDGQLMRWRYGKKDYPWNEMISPPNAK